MPLKQIDITTAPGFVVQTCAMCGMERKVSLNRGGIDTKPGPFNIAEGSTLEVKVDGQEQAQIVTFEVAAFPDFAAVTAEQLRDQLNASLHGATAVLNVGGTAVSIESDAVGETSRIEVVGGSAREALGIPVAAVDPNPGRPHLGHELTPTLTNPNIICLRRCPCGANEMIVRTWDVCNAKFAGSHFYEHRRAANALANYFKAQGWIEEACAEAIGNEASNPTDFTPGLPGAVINVPAPQPEPGG